MELLHNAQERKEERRASKQNAYLKTKPRICLQTSWVWKYVGQELKDIQMEAPFVLKVSTSAFFTKKMFTVC